MITGMDFVALPVTDMARARAFYTETLGLTTSDEPEGNWQEYDLGDGPALALINNAAYGMPVGPVTAGSVAIAYADFEGTTEKVKDRLVQKPFEGNVCHGAFIRDSEGNAVTIHRRKAEPKRNHAIDFVVMPIQDMKRARAFYEGTLGFKPETVDEKGIWTEYVLPDGSALALGDTTVMGIPFAPNTTGSVGLRTPDLDAAWAKLKGLGMNTMDEPYESPVCFMGYIRDTEGNSLVLHKHKEGRA